MKADDKKAFISNNRFWISVVVGIIIFIWLGFLFTPQKPVVYPNYLTSSPSPTGVKAFYTVLKDRYGKLDIWKKPVYELPQSAKQLMVMVDPYRLFTTAETEEWIKWMEAGNDIWLLREDPTGFFDIKTNTFADESLLTVYGNGPFQGSYQAEVNSNQRILYEIADRSLLRIGGSGTIALSRNYGEGQLFVLLTPDWLSNQHVLEYQHLEMVLTFVRLADPEVIWFNDFIHGDKTVTSITEVYPRWFILLAAQLGFIALLWVWTKGKRFGSVVTPREWVVRFGDERIKALAAWSLRGGFYQESLIVQEKFLRNTVQDKWGIPSTLSGKEWLTAVKRRLPDGKLKQWEVSWEELQLLLTNKVSRKDYLSWSKRLNSMRKDVEE